MSAPSRRRRAAHSDGAVAKAPGAGADDAGAAAAASNDKAGGDTMIDDVDAIHFVYLGLWGGADLPAKFRANLDKWKAANRGRAVKLWDASAVDALVARHFPGPAGQEAYARAPPISKADLARLFILVARGGWYSDLDTGVDCDHQRLQALSGGGWRGGGGGGGGGGGTDVARGCSNDLDKVQAALGLNPARHSGVLVWEMGRKTPAEAARAAERWPALRLGIPEYRTRLSNYFLWCRPGCAVLKRALALALHRLQRLDGSASSSSSSSSSNMRNSGDHKGTSRDNGNARAKLDEVNIVRRADLRTEAAEYAVLWSTGPDVVTESALGVRDTFFDDDDDDDDDDGAAAAAASSSSIGGGVHRGRDVAETLTDGQGTTRDGTLIADPGSLVVNANSFSWRGRGNAALKSPGGP